MKVREAYTKRAAALVAKGGIDSMSYACGARVFNTTQLDRLYDPFPTVALAERLEQLRDLHRTWDSPNLQDLVRWHVRGGNVYHCGPAPSSEMAWEKRYRGAARTLQRFFRSECGRQLGDFELWINLDDLPIQRLYGSTDAREPSTGRRATRRWAPRTALVRKWRGRAAKPGERPFPTFGYSAMPALFADIPLPTEALLEPMKAHLAELDDEGQRDLDKKAAVVHARVGGSSWGTSSDEAAKDLEELYGPSWWRSHRVAMCSLPAYANWTDLGVISSQVSGATDCPERLLNAAFQPFGERASAKYHLVTDGSASEFYDAVSRAAGVVLQPESPYATWLTSAFEDGKHHVAVRRDLSDLHSKYLALEADPARAKAIFERGDARAREVISPKAVECYLCEVFTRYVRYYRAAAAAASESADSAASEDADSLEDTLKFDCVERADSRERMHLGRAIELAQSDEQESLRRYSERRRLR